MFTGIVQDIVTITAVKSITGGRRVSITLPLVTQYQVGDSILLNGICSTVVAVTSNSLVVEYMPQTERLTTVGTWVAGTRLNCEAPLTLQTKISGSLVTGHVDCIGQIASLNHSAEETTLSVVLPQPRPRFVVAQGAITIDGVNLTISAISSATVLQVSIIPHTLKHTIIQHYTADTAVNIEYDYIAKLFLAQAV